MRALSRAQVWYQLRGVKDDILTSFNASLYAWAEAVRIASCRSCKGSSSSSHSAIWLKMVPANIKKGCIAFYTIIMKNVRRTVGFCCLFVFLLSSVAHNSIIHKRSDHFKRRKNEKEDEEEGRMKEDGELERTR